MAQGQNISYLTALLAFYLILYKQLFLKKKLVFAAISFFLMSLCAAQKITRNVLVGKWEGKRHDIIIRYRFLNDSLYNTWTNKQPDSLHIYHYNISDGTYFHIIDDHHFYILVTFYATEKVIFHKVKDFTSSKK